uniref:Uncharacterized protein n=1 Tax=Grammatophora oceanica TaxID=210454 RepID=A0A7S1VDP4_9STRA|mmetsp:Transcript_42264/g.62644  ORF Transcript_42264/g.62644 Transcript_42264/m.62644 type:complete len:557 (+) Transcript_42264:256-1926(+)|eukprot:CAMPEP_0194040538 /NCGR_PEP_ID=MMETSP0009_2-20130614/12505_1 /TAXON_ID=210454 /ORGANISM="Grammatophora oceanica, Strain CCMP 410" /LENGTH=556 /DNA_ID=CAMNT_0038683697 /DNA_START=196 /DNA_END=1866 /DNA_ORIENTATION=+
MRLLLSVETTYVVLCVILSCLSFVDANSFLRDVVQVGSSSHQKQVRDERLLNNALLAKAIPIEEYKSRLAKNGLKLMNNNEEEERRRRRLDDKDDDDDFYVNQNNLYAFSGYSLKYAQCQTIQKFSEDAIKDGEYSAMVTDDVVILRLCPKNSCSSSKQWGCHYNFAEYAMDLIEYMTIMIQFSIHQEEMLCEFCADCGFLQNNNNNNNNRRRRLEDEEEGEDGEEEGDEEDEENFDDDDYYAENDDGAAAAADDDDGGNAAAADDDGGNAAAAADDDEVALCNSYYDTCYSLTNKCAGAADDDAGYLQYADYLDYLACVKLEAQDDDQYYWVRPKCDSSYSTIKMAIFYDPYCSQYAGNEINLREFSGIKFNNELFEDYYAGNCIDCSESNYPPFYDLNSNFCNKMHFSSARCTDNLGYDLFGDDGSSDHKTECSFIESVRFGTYNDKGEIYMDGSQYGESVKPEVTVGQKWGLAVSILLCVALAVYSCYLHHSITNLLIKSLSHSHLLPPSRHRAARSRSKSSRKGGGNGNSVRTKTSKVDDWDHSVGAPPQIT